ncbi:MAG: TonB-dependent receptor [Steroidobacteraceae bacterium]
MQIRYSFYSMLMAPLAATAAQAEVSDLQASVLESVIVTATRSAPTSLPTQIPTTLEGVTKERVAQTVNATDSEDAIKYFPSLLVRKRYIGDYNHAVLSSRASGTGNSARSAVYADGILISNYLGNGATYAPRWMLVTPEEIERVDVMYGPFSAAYPGNSVGAIVDYVTRMPDKFEAHAKVTYVVQPFELYNTDDTYTAHQESASVGDRAGNLSWWLNFNHLNSHGQPQTFPNKTVANTVLQGGETPVTGAVLALNRNNQPWYLLGTATEYTTIQDHAKLKLAYDFSDTLRLSYLLGYWRNDAEGRPQSYLRDASGNTVYSGNVNIDGYRYSLSATDFNLSNDAQVHLAQGLSLKSNSGGVWDYEVAASLFDYRKDEQRAPTVALPMAATAGAGTLTDQDGTGWSTLALKGTWRPQEEHTVDMGYAIDSYRLRLLKININNWLVDTGGVLNSDVGGKTRTQALYAQDAWSFARDWRAVLGMRLEQWQARDGFTRITGSATEYTTHNATYASPKAALAWQLNSDTAVKASVGRAVRFPTVNELYGATSGGALTVINDPNLKPEKSWTGELTLQQQFNDTSLRVTGFYEVVRDSLYSERTAVSGSIVSRITNVGKIVTPGIEVALNSKDLYINGLDASGSLTWADSRIRQNDGYVTVPGDTIGKYQPRVPEWRVSALLNYRITDALNMAYGARYSGKQYSTLDNSDPNGFAYQGASKYLTTDVRVRWQFLPQWTAALGVDNLNNYKYWNFHPYPQRSYSAELGWDW